MLRQDSFIPPFIIIIIPLFVNFRSLIQNST
jgi:hypothetical protein